MSFSTGEIRKLCLSVAVASTNQHTAQHRIDYIVKALQIPTRIPLTTLPFYF